ncbi:MAG: hypothetical protein ACLVJH_18160 [Faecalibacterium prausnitzii]
MSYVKQNFVDGQTLTAAQLNHMEAGIANAAGTQGEKGDKGEKGDPGPAGAKVTRARALPPTQRRCC